MDFRHTFPAVNTVTTMSYDSGKKWRIYHGGRGICGFLRKNNYWTSELEEANITCINENYPPIDFKSPEEALLYYFSYPEGS